VNNEHKRKNYVYGWLLLGPSIRTTICRIWLRNISLFKALYRSWYGLIKSESLCLNVLAPGGERRPMQFNRAKFKDVVLYTCHKCDRSKLGAVKLNKVLYFADMVRYAWTGGPVTGATYKKRKHGPTTDQLLPALRELVAEHRIQINDVNYFGFTKKEYVPLVEPDITRLSKEEIILLDQVIDFVCSGNTAKTISEYSHQTPWEMVEFGEEIPYHTAFLLYPSEVSLEALEWAEAEANAIADQGAQSEQVAYTDGSVFRRRLLEAR
jgi:Protein of unknown function (DUF4065)